LIQGVHTRSTQAIIQSKNIYNIFTHANANGMKYEHHIEKNTPTNAVKFMTFPNSKYCIVCFVSSNQQNNDRKKFVCASKLSLSAYHRPKFGAVVNSLQWSNHASQTVHLRLNSSDLNTVYLIILHKHKISIYFNRLLFVRWSKIS
jgi:hypothetical protein